LSADDSGRINKMEMVAIGKRSYVPQAGTVRHIYASGVPYRISDPWFLSDSDLSRMSVAEVSNYMAMLGRRLSGPGILTLRRPSGTAHPAFTKYFYNRNLAEGLVADRYIYAFANMRKTSSSDEALY